MGLQAVANNKAVINRNAFCGLKVAVISGFLYFKHNRKPFFGFPAIRD
jgi:hypothetical protein